MSALFWGIFENFVWRKNFETRSAISKGLLLSVASQSKSSWRKKTLLKSYLITMKPLTKHSLILCSSSPSRSTTCWILKDIEPTMHAQTMLYHSIWHLPPVTLSCAIFIMKFFMYVLVQRWKLWWHVIWNISTAKYCKQIITEMWRLW